MMALLAVQKLVFHDFMKYQNSGLNAYTCMYLKFILVDVDLAPL